VILTLECIDDGDWMSNCKMMEVEDIRMEYPRKTWWHVVTEVV